MMRIVTKEKINSKNCIELDWKNVADNKDIGRRMLTPNVGRILYCHLLGEMVQVHVATGRSLLRGKSREERDIQTKAPKALLYPAKAGLVHRKTICKCRFQFQGSRTPTGSLCFPWIWKSLPLLPGNPLAMPDLLLRLSCCLPVFLSLLSWERVAEISVDSPAYKSWQWNKKCLDEEYRHFRKWGNKTSKTWDFPKW